MRAVKHDKPESEMLTVGQVASYLNIHPNTVRRWAKRGFLDAYRIGPRNDRRFKLADVEELLLNGQWRASQPSESSPSLARVGDV